MLLKAIYYFGISIRIKNLRYASSYFPKNVLHFRHKVRAVLPLGNNDVANCESNMSPAMLSSV